MIRRKGRGVSTIVSQCLNEHVRNDGDKYRPDNYSRIDFLEHR